MSAGVLAVEAAFDVEHRGRNRQREQSDRGTVAGHQGLGELADLLLFETLPAAFAAAAMSAVRPAPEASNFCASLSIDTNAAQPLLCTSRIH